VFSKRALSPLVAVGFQGAPGAAAPP
jgi:hypothetical protein